MNEKQLIKKYFDDILKQADEAVEKNDLDLAEELLSIEFDNPLLDLETGKIFSTKLHEIRLTKESFTLESQLSKVNNKTDFYAKIYDKQHKFVNETFLEVFLTKYINELDNIDIAFINSIFSEDQINILRKIDVLEVLIRNNISIEIDFYNPFLNTFTKINPSNYLDVNNGIVLTKNQKFINVYDYVMNHYHKEPSFLQFAQTFVYAFLFYHFPNEMEIDENKMKKTFIKLIENFRNQEDLEMDYDEQDIADKVMSVLQNFES